MTRKQLTAWVAALRSGRYQQTTNCLRNTESHEHSHHSFCCLGVLADTIDSHAWHNGSWYYGDVDCDDNGVSLTPLPAEIMDERTQGLFVGMNDNDRRDFAYIANYAERYVKTTD